MDKKIIDMPFKPVIIIDSDFIRSQLKLKPDEEIFWLPVFGSDNKQKLQYEILAKRRILPSGPPV